MKKIYFMLMLAGILGFQTSQAQFSLSVPVLEEFTGTWCGWCVDGAYRVDDIRSTYPKAAVVSIHSGSAGEPMAFPDGDQVAAFYTSSYPSGVISREGAAIGRTQWKAAIATALNGASSVTVGFDSVSFDPVSRSLTVRIKADFTGPVIADLRMNVFLAEDNVTGGSAYNQANYDNTTPNHPYQNAGNPIVGFVHNQVVREMMGGAWGNSGIIPGSVNFGQSYTETFTTTLDAGWDENEMFLVGVVQEYGSGISDRKILNGEHMPLLPVTNIEEGIGSHAQFISLYPNPSKGLINITFSLEQDDDIKIEVLNTLGQQITTVAQGYMNSGAHTQIWDARNAANGVYLVKITAGEHSLTQRVMIAH